MIDGPNWEHGHREMEQIERGALPPAPADPRSSAERVMWDRSVDIQAALEIIVGLLKRVMEALSIHT